METQQNIDRILLDDATLETLRNSNIPQLNGVTWEHGVSSRDGNLIINATLPDGRDYRNVITGDFGSNWQEADHLEVVCDNDGFVTAWYFIENIDAE